MKTISIIVLIVAVIVLAGVVAWQGLVQPKPSSALPATNQPAATTSDETAGWNTYVTDNYTLKYPNDWQMKEVSGILHFSDPNTNTPYYTADIATEPRNSESLDEWLKQNPQSACLSKIKEINTDNIKGVLVKQSCTIGNDAVMAVIPYNEYFLTISYASSSTVILDQILSTFKFLK